MMFPAKSLMMSSVLWTERPLLATGIDQLKKIDNISTANSSIIFHNLSSIHGLESRATHSFENAPAENHENIGSF